MPAQLRSGGPKPTNRRTCSRGQETGVGHTSGVLVKAKLGLAGIGSPLAFYDTIMRAQGQRHARTCGHALAHTLLLVVPLQPLEGW